MWIVQAHEAHSARYGVDRKDSAQIYKDDKNMEGKSYDDRLRYLGLWTLEERRQDLIELYKIQGHQGRYQSKARMRAPISR